MAAVYVMRIKNTMYAYERDQLYFIEAENDDEAFTKAKSIDCYAEITIEEVKELK